MAVVVAAIMDLVEEVVMDLMVTALLVMALMVMVHEALQVSGLESSDHS